MIRLYLELAIYHLTGDWISASVTRAMIQSKRKYMSNPTFP